MEPVISIVMTVYNHQNYIQKAVKSVLNQSFSNFELIVVDDASTDSSYALLKTFRDPRIKIIHNRKNLGTTRSLNKGLMRATGEYRCIMCSDDWLPKNSLKLRFEAITKNNYDVVHGGLKRIDTTSKTTKYIRPLQSTQDMFWFITQKPRGIGINTAAFLVHRSVFEKVGFFSMSNKTKYNRDYEFSLRVIYNCRCAWLNKNVYNYRIHAANNSHKNWSTEQSQRNFAYIEGKYKKLFWNKYARKQSPVKYHRSFIFE